MIFADVKVEWKSKSTLVVTHPASRVATNSSLKGGANAWKTHEDQDLLFLMSRIVPCVLPVGAFLEGIHWYDPAQLPIGSIQNRNSLGDQRYSTFWTQH